MEFASSSFLTTNHVTFLTSLLLASFKVVFALYQLLEENEWNLGTAIKFKKLCLHNDVTLRHCVNQIIPRCWKWLANYSVKLKRPPSLPRSQEAKTKHGLNTGQVTMRDFDDPRQVSFPSKSMLVCIHFIDWGLILHFNLGENLPWDCGPVPLQRVKIKHLNTKWDQYVHGSNFTWPLKKIIFKMTTKYELRGEGGYKWPFFWVVS